MKRIMIVPNPGKDPGLEITKKTVSKLADLGFAVSMDKSYTKFGVALVDYLDDPALDSELIIVIGGDGSVIDASTVAVRADIPILGINLGKVGYLSEVEPSEINVISKIAKGEYKIVERMLLSAEKYNAQGESTLASRLAVNDVIISNEVCSIADLTVENGQGDLIKYRADGVVVATPIGSTAYSLSAGGPVVSHNIDSIIVTPVCPHSLFNRSIIFEPSEFIKVTNNSQRELCVGMDGRKFSKLSRGECVVIKRSEKRLKMLTFTENKMLSALFKKIRALEESV